MQHVLHYGARLAEKRKEEDELSFDHFIYLPL